MYRRSILVVAVLLGLLGVSAIPALDDAANDDANPQLTEQVQQLVQRVTELEQQVAELKKRQAVFLLPRSPNGTPQNVVPPTLERVPKEWDRREINGQPYYIVPANGRQRKP